MSVKEKTVDESEKLSTTINVWPVFDMDCIGKATMSVYYQVYSRALHKCRSDTSE